MDAQVLHQRDESANLLTICIRFRFVARQLQINLVGLKHAAHRSAETFHIGKTHFRQMLDDVINGFAFLGQHHRHVPIAIAVRHLDG